jgi:NADH-quinone oxidoreductase subunit M
MILAALILIPFVGGLVAWAIAGRSHAAARWLSLAAMAAVIVLALAGASGTSANSGRWLAETRWPWIPQLGISIHLALDGLSLLLVLLVGLLGMMAVGASWTEIERRVGFFHFNLLWALAALVGLFLAVDLFLFFFFWEMVLVPMYFVIALWGHENRFYAAIKFFLFTQFSGLVMLLAILGLYFVHAGQAEEYTFDYERLLGTSTTGPTAMLLLLGFVVGFAVKLPAVPLHAWLPDAHTEAPTGGSVILAGLLLKAGAYGLLRFAVPLFPAAAAQFAPWAMAIGVAGILHGALLAFGQEDLKRLVAYTSISHMGFVMLGVFARNELALQGVVIQILCHGLSTGALFIIAGALQERLHTREMGRMGGLYAGLPRMGNATLLFSLGGLGLPGLGNFVGEVLILLGTYQRSPAAAAVAALGLIVSTVYSLWVIQRAFHGPTQRERLPHDLTGREMAMLGALAAALVWLGVYPRTALETSRPAIERLSTGTPAQTRKAQLAPLSVASDSIPTGSYEHN